MGYDYRKHFGEITLTQDLTTLPEERTWRLAAPAWTETAAIPAEASATRRRTAVAASRRRPLGRSKLARAAVTPARIRRGRCAAQWAVRPVLH